MKIKDLLLESYKDALDKFSNDAPTDEVESYLDKFRQLTKKNIITGTDKDIGKWIKGDWADFKTMIDNKSKEKSKSQIKKAKKKDSIVVYEDDDKMVVVPLSKDASCFYGRQTKWCTAATDTKNWFNNYFFKNDITLFYVLLSDGSKYAAAYNVAVNVFEFFDKLDKSMSDTDFTKATGVSLDQIRRLYNDNKGAIEKARANVRHALSEEALDSGDPRKVYEHAMYVLHGPFPRGEDIIATSAQFSYAYARYVLEGPFPIGEDLIATSAEYSYDYATDILKGKPFVKGEDAIATDASYSYRYARDVLDGPFPKGEKTIARVNVYAEWYADEILKGEPFPVREEYVIGQIKKSPSFIASVDHPTLDMQIAAVSTDPLSIRDITDPAEQVQILAVQTDSRSIKYISRPNPIVKIHAGIMNDDTTAYMNSLDDRAQIELVAKTPNLIKLVSDPSDGVIIAAIQNTTPLNLDRISKYIPDNRSSRVQQAYDDIVAKNKSELDDLLNTFLTPPK